VSPTKQMVVHGFVVSGLGIVYGFAHRHSLKKYTTADRRTDLWRAAHSSTSVAGALMIAIGAAFASHGIAPAQTWPLNLVWPCLLLTIVTGYAFAAAIGTAALSTGPLRGHTWGATALNRLSYVLYVIAMVTCTLSSLLFTPLLWSLLVE
jgi:hypothetical protein